jgi:L-threonylcarbamoyladenylate synthase
VTRISLHEAIRQACEVLARGGIILYPADTIWGIGCDATDAGAIRRLEAIKERGPGKGWITLVHSLEQLYDVVARIHPRVDTLLHHHERPLTVIYPEARPAYRHLTAEDGSLAVRVVRPGFCKDLLEAYGRPLVSTSANLSGMPAPTAFGGISTEIIRQADYSVPAYFDKDMTGMASVIARYDPQGDLEFLRRGVNAPDEAPSADPA